MRGFLTRFRNCVRRRLTQAMSDQNIFAAVLDKIRAANTALIKDGALPFGIDQSRIVVEPPRESAHGDMATNAAMVLAKDAGAKPRVLAEAIAAKLRSDDLVAKAEVAGPGFINLTLKPKAWIGALRAVLAAGANYGRSNVGGGSSACDRVGRGPEEQAGGGMAALGAASRHRDDDGPDPQRPARAQGRARRVFLRAVAPRAPSRSGERVNRRPAARRLRVRGA